ncbi:hypothetical protein MLD38_034570 [Melastoma candidum]|uniref:Uncharacterized protein n=1 Tax=Melastoma candidum TaxID=119954 RepID=A0ACB9MCE7_9MYRT|nr:hypothetical protein MLD38_034570 [Melastoma candidum]
MFHLTVHGAIIIFPPEGSSYPYPEPDGQQVFVLASWYKGDVNAEVKYDLAEGLDTPRSDAYTINGQPGDFCNCSRESTVHWYVDYGKTYLIRLVNAVMNVEMFFAIGQHNLTVVGMDGSYLKPFVTTFVMLSPGQTMDILVTANQSLGSYYVASRQYDTVKPDVDDYDHANVTAIMQYNGNYTPTGAPSSLPLYLSMKTLSRPLILRVTSGAWQDRPCIELEQCQLAEPINRCADGLLQGTAISTMSPVLWTTIWSTPPEVNTVPVPKKGWVANRFTASNPGVWFWHCHFDRHLSWGMDTVFIVKNGGTPNTTMRDPPSFMPTCKSSLRFKNQGRFASHRLHNLDA